MNGQEALKILKDNCSDNAETIEAFAILSGLLYELTTLKEQARMVSVEMKVPDSEFDEVLYLDTYGNYYLSPVTKSDISSTGYVCEDYDGHTDVVAWMDYRRLIQFLEEGD